MTHLPLTLTTLMMMMISAVEEMIGIVMTRAQQLQQQIRKMLLQLELIVLTQILLLEDTSLPSLLH